MSDRVAISRGATPWLPSTDAETVVTLSYYDRPLLGIFRRHGVPFLFRCMFGELSSTQTWLYVTLTDDEASQLQSSAGAAFNDLVDQLSSGDAVIALATDEGGILYFEAQDLTGVPAGDLARTVVRSLSAHLDQIAKRWADLEGSTDHWTSSELHDQASAAG